MTTDTANFRAFKAINALVRISALADGDIQQIALDAIAADDRLIGGSVCNEGLDAHRFGYTQQPSAPSAEPAAVACVTECEACFTPDACQLRGKCDHYAAEQLRVARGAAPLMANGLTEAETSATASVAGLTGRDGDDRHCRDCADFGPICPNSGEPCGGTAQAATASVAGLAEPVKLSALRGMLPMPAQAAAEPTDEEIGHVTVEKARTALDSMDDYARMQTGVDAMGPRRTLEVFIDQAGRATPQAAPVPTVQPPIVAEVLAELERATRKFPTWPTDPLHALAVLGEEFGELTKDALQLTYEPHKTNAANVRTEAIQTAAMALRWAMSMDRYDYMPGVQHVQAGIPAAAQPTKE